MHIQSKLLLNTLVLDASSDLGQPYRSSYISVFTSKISCRRIIKYFLCLMACPYYGAPCKRGSWATAVASFRNGLLKRKGKIA